MAQKTKINGTNYKISKGKTLVGGTAYDVYGGKTLVDGANYNVATTPIVIVVATCKPGMTTDSLFPMGDVRVKGENGNNQWGMYTGGDGTLGIETRYLPVGTVIECAIGLSKENYDGSMGTSEITIGETVVKTLTTGRSNRDYYVTYDYVVTRNAYIYCGDMDGDRDGKYDYGFVAIEEY